MHLQNYSSREIRAANLSLSLGNFSVGMGAFLVVGVLEPISVTFGRTLADGAVLLAVYAAVYAVTSPILASVTGRLQRRTLLAASLTLFAAASVLAAVAWDWSSLLTARALAAVGGAIYSPGAASVAFGITPPERRGRSLATVFLGLQLAQAAGVPLGLILSEAFGWRAAFVASATLAGIAIACLLTWVPAGVPTRSLSLRAMGSALSDLGAMLPILVTVIHLAAFGMIYTFLVPLAERSAVNSTLALVLFGIGCTASGQIAGWYADRKGSKQACLLIVISQIAVLPIFSMWDLSAAAFLCLITVWSTAGGGISVPQQMFLGSRYADRLPIMMALNATATYTGTAIGAALSGEVVRSTGLSNLGFFGAILALIALITLAASQRLSSRAL